MKLKFLMLVCLIFSSLQLLQGAETLKIDVAGIDRERIMKAAALAMKLEPVTITSFPAKLSEGGINDFYSNGDYWWPNPKKPNGLPYIKKDGETNPENFGKHRLALKALRDGTPPGKLPGLADAALMKAAMREDDYARWTRDFLAG